MANFKYDKRFSVGIQSIDEEHAKLFQLMEEIRSSLSLGRGRQVIGSVLRDLLNYTQTHFVNEEALMVKYQYPDYTSHKQYHDNFVDTVVKATRDYLEGKTIPVVKIKELLFDWLVEHIKEQDKRMATYLISKGVPPQDLP